MPNLTLWQQGLWAMGCFRWLRLDRHMRVFRRVLIILGDNKQVLKFLGMVSFFLWLFCSFLKHEFEKDNAHLDVRKYYVTAWDSLWLILVELSGNSPIVPYTTAGVFITIFQILITMGVVTIPIALIANSLPDAYPPDEAAVGAEAHRLLTKPSKRKHLNPWQARKEDEEWEKWMDEVGFFLGRKMWEKWTFFLF